MQKMKLTKLVVRTWIGATTMIGFVGGWAMLAHSGKPVTTANAQAAQVTQSNASASVAAAPVAVPTLAPIPSLDQLVGGAQLQPVQPLPALPRITGNIPRARTGGS
jgi:hypothetical protein